MNSTTSTGTPTRRPRTGLSALVTGLALLALSFIVGFVLIPSVAAHATTTPPPVGAAASPAADASPRTAASMAVGVAVLDCGLHAQSQPAETEKLGPPDRPVRAEALA